MPRPQVDKWRGRLFQRQLDGVLDWLESNGGDDGASAYEVAVADGFVGDEAAWLASLVGADGDDSTVPGPTGPAGPAGPAIPFIVLGKTSAVSQNVGGANGTEVFWTWNTQIKTDAAFTHSVSVNSARIEVTDDGWYEVTFVGHAQQGGVARTSFQGIHRVNGGTTSRRGSVGSYARGSNFGNPTPSALFTVQLTAGDYIELGTLVEDTDAAYTTNTSGAEIDDESHFLQIKKVA